MGMENDNKDFTSFVKRWTITVTYIAVVLTGILFLKLYELFIQ